MSVECTDQYDEIEKDREHFVKILGSFKFFGVQLLKKIEEKRVHFTSLSPSKQHLITEFETSLKQMKSCLIHNSKLFDKIIANAAPDIFNGEHSGDVLNTFDQSSLKATDAKRSSEQPATPSKFGPFAYTTADMDKVRSTMKQFVRDWSSVGKSERNICYGLVIEEVCRIYDPSEINPRKVRILVPGAGLGRLAWELAYRGYACQGNEWSLHMLIPAYFILNTCKVSNEHTLYPWVSQFCNFLKRQDQLSPVSFPDVCPSDIPPDVPFSMVAGNFTDVYVEPDSWDCVATVFFIDTAHNVLDYMETIWKILKPGGYWINFGPLLYHFSDVPGEQSLELSFDELRLAIERMGFQTLKEKTNIRCGYTQNPNSMLSYEYDCVYGLYKKPLDNSNGKMN